jgi:hypothetical protein
MYRWRWHAPLEERIKRDRTGNRLQLFFVNYPLQVKVIFLCSMSFLTLEATCIADSWALLKILLFLSFYRFHNVKITIPLKRFLSPCLSWFWPPPTMRLNGLDPEVAGSIGHRSAPRIEWDSILLWRMGKVVKSAVMSQVVRCTKRSVLMGPSSLLQVICREDKKHFFLNAMAGALPFN